MIDVVTLNYNDAETTIDFVNQVSQFAAVRKIVVVDNCSTDNSVFRLNQVKSEKVAVIVSEKNGGYGAGNNLGIRYLVDNYKSERILLSNPDVITDNETLVALEFFLKNNADYAVAAPVMKNPVGDFQYNTAMKIPSVFEFLMTMELVCSKFFHPMNYSRTFLESKRVQNVGAVSGSMFMMNAENMLKHGMFDENIFLYCEELTLGMKLKSAGLKTALLTDVGFIHNHSVSISKSFKTVASRNKLMNKSRIYVLQKYYKANALIRLFACFLSKVAMLEIGCANLLRK